MPTPLMIEIGLWYSTRGPAAGDHRACDAPSGPETFKQFVACGLLTENPKGSRGLRRYEPTGLLEEWCGDLCKVRWPSELETI